VDQDQRNGAFGTAVAEPVETPLPIPAGTAWQRALGRFGYAAGPNQTPLRERLVPPFRKPALSLSGLLGMPPVSARVSGWLGAVLIALFAGVLRFWNLGRPNQVIFDETYYPKDAWSLLRNGYETGWPKDADKLLTGATPSVHMGDDPSYIVHPPLGKWMIAAGEWVFGMGPFGWRFSTALLGTLAVLMLARIARRLFRSTLLGCVAAALLSLDGLEFVMSRTALLDLILMFWVLAAFGCLLVDRDRMRGLLADAVGERPNDAIAARVNLGWRPWRIAAGLCLGAACATKWNGLYILAAFGLLTVLWDVGARRLAGARRPWRAALTRDAAPAFASTVVLSVAVYVVSWSGWLFTKGGYNRNWADTHDGGFVSFVPGPLRALWDYHRQMYDFHTHLSADHDYQSNPWSWLVLGRPVSYYYETVGQGKDGCGAKECAREVLALGTPALWWAAVPALLFVLYQWAARRDWRAGAILCGVAAGYLPWFMYQDRTIFYFYAVVFVPFLCLAVTMALGALIGPEEASDTRRAWGTAIAGVVVAAVALNFIYFYPIYSGGMLPSDAWHDRMWFNTWI
jgi:dolichyl-phosphate-mannose--protein O-mannosyl transferase